MNILIKNIEHIERTSKEGKPFVSCKITSYSEKLQKDIYISGFGSSITKTFSAGDTVDIDIEQNEQGYWNFSENENTKPSPDKKLALLLEINRKLDMLIGTKELAKELGGEVVEEKKEIDPTSIPF